MPLQIKTRFINCDDVQIYFGVDLRSKFSESGNPNESATAFIMRLEDRMEAFVEGNFHRKVYYDQMSDYQKECWRKALLEQAIYIYRNGDISVGSGFDYENGETASNETIVEKSVAPNAKMYLKMCGLWCRHIGNGLPFYMDAGWFNPNRN